MSEPKYPNIHVDLTQIDGNAFSIIGHTMRAMRAAGLPESECATYRKEAMSGNYDNLIDVTTSWVSTS